MFCPLACIFPSVQDQGIEMRVIEEGMHHSLLHRLEHISERNTFLPFKKRVKSNLASSLKFTDNHILSQFKDCNFSLCNILNPTLTDS